MVEWEDEHGRLGLNVNISGAQLRQASLVREVAEILEATGLEPGPLTLEITESVLMEVSSSNTERLDALEQLGVQLAVDDFRTGYSSLQYLKRFPFDWLKIAEGIESKRQATVLGEIGCLNGQGFHYSPPLPAEEISAYLAAEVSAR